jgi:hypothetical protein
MKKEIKKIWVKALRSGKYNQAQEKLCQTVDGEDYYCCLGVLANECADGFWIKNDDRDRWELKIHGMNPPFDPGKLPNQFLDEIDLYHEDHDRLIKLNDRHGMDFNQIADWIEKNL